MSWIHLEKVSFWIVGTRRSVLSKPDRFVSVSQPQLFVRASASSASSEWSNVG